jgi:hypothetical protein
MFGKLTQFTQPMMNWLDRNFCIGSTAQAEAVGWRNLEAILASAYQPSARLEATEKINVRINLSGGSFFRSHCLESGRWPWSQPRLRTTLIIMGDRDYIKEVLYLSEDDSAQVFGWHYSGGAISTIAGTVGQLKRTYGPAPIYP